MAAAGPLTPVASYPSITDSEFATACRSFVTRWHDVALQSHLELELGGDKLSGVYIKVIRPLVLEQDQIEALVASESEDLTEEDEDAMKPQPKSRRHHLEYNIIFSPTYQVPVLYFLIRNLPPSDVPMIDRMRDLVVPDEYKAQIEAVGVMGGISFAEHPILGTPAFFVHPCNTAIAMSEVSDGKSIVIDEYIQVWLGVVGGCVGFSLPLQV